MMIRFGRGLAPLAAAFALVAVPPGCSPDRGPEDLIAPDGAGELVLDAVLVVDRPFPTVFLSRTVSPLAAFSFSRVAEPGAQVEIRTGGRPVADYQETPVPGTYDTRGSAFGNLVEPETAYEVVAVTADGRTVRGTTVTPPRFRVNEWLLLENDSQTVRRPLETFRAAGEDIYDQNEITYADGLLEARFDRPDVVAFQVAVRNLEADSPLVVEPDFLDEEDLSRLERSLSSPALTGEDSLLRLPWLAIYYEGRTIVRIHAIDRNWFDLIRSTPGLDNGPGAFAFGGNLGEGFEQPIFHIQGGIGLVGSSSVDSLGFRVLAP